MADNGTKDARNITTQETDTRLRQLAIFLLGLTHLRIDELHCLLESSKLGHCIRDLSGPQRIQSLVQTTKPFLGHDLAPPLSEPRSIWWEGSLHANLDRLHWTQGHISEELGRGTGTQEDQGAVGLREQLVAVEMLEVLVQSVLASTLEGVA